MIKAYFDGTGTDGKSPIGGFGGLFGNDESWTEFDAAWTEQLAYPLGGRKPPLRRFHMAACMARNGDYSGYSEGEQDAIIHDFRQIIIKSGVWGYAMVVSRKDWADIMPVHYQQIVGTPEAFCFRDVIGRLIGFINVHSADADLAIAFDDGPENTKTNKLAYRQFEGLPIRTHLAGLSFLSNSMSTPLQGADMWAWEVFNQAKQSLIHGSLQKPRHHALAYHDSGRFEANWCDRASICNMADVLSDLSVPQGAGYE